MRRHGTPALAASSCCRFPGIGFVAEAPLIVKRATYIHPYQSSPMAPIHIYHDVSITPWPIGATMRQSAGGLTNTHARRGQADPCVAVATPVLA
jgi:hypothetical protein